MNKYAYMKMMFPQEMLKIAAEEEDSKEAIKAKKKEEKARNKAENNAGKSERRRAGKWHSQNFGGLTSAATSGLVGALLGAGVGGLTKTPDITIPANPQAGIDQPVTVPGGRHPIAGAVTGGLVGVLASLLANKTGAGLAGFAGPRTLKKQKDYNSSVGSTLANYFIPGVSGWNKARTAMTKDEEDAVLQEFLLQQKLKDSGLA